MENQLSEIQICTCGRLKPHCPRCGKKPSYHKKTISTNLTTILGKQIDVFRCSTCGDFRTDQTCRASKITVDVLDSEANEGFQPGSIAYATAMNEWVSEYSVKNKVNVNKAYAEAMRKGWKVDAYPMTDELKEELILQGLIEAPPEQAPEQIEEKEASVDLGDIIKAMQTENPSEGEK